MAYDERLAERVRAELAEYEELTAQRMFGGLAFMVGGHMLCGVMGDELIVRVGKERQDRALARAHARQMRVGDRTMGGFVVVAPEGVRTARQLGRWLADAEAFVATLPPKAPAAGRRAGADG